MLSLSIEVFVNLPFIVVCNQNFTLEKYFPDCFYFGLGLVSFGFRLVIFSFGEFELSLVTQKYALGFVKVTHVPTLEDSTTNVPTK